jgi:hypothetical protein
MNYFTNKIIYLFLALLLICSLNLGMTEHFKMFPVRDVFCEEQGLKKAYGPTMCVFEDGTFNLHTNCRCVDPVTGYCKECYPEVKKQFATLISKKKWRRMMKNRGYNYRFD